MAAFTKNILKQESALLKPVHAVLRKELNKNYQEVQDRLSRLCDAAKDKRRHAKLVNDEGFKEEDCRRLLRILKTDIEKSEKLLKVYLMPNACCGDSCLCGNLPGFSGKELDLLMIAERSAVVCKWAGGDCKFGVKPGKYGLFVNERNFRSEIDDKFENVQKHFNRLGEVLLPQRMIFVTSSSLAQCQRLFNNLKLGKIPHGIVKGRYSFQTIDTIAKLLRRHPK